MRGDRHKEADFGVPRFNNADRHRRSTTGAAGAFDRYSGLLASNGRGHSGTVCFIRMRFGRLQFAASFPPKLAGPAARAVWRMPGPAAKLRGDRKKPAATSTSLVAEVAAMARWKKDPLEYFEGDQRTRAIEALYWYEGFDFDRLSRTSDPFFITERDIVAVSMLSVNVAPAAAVRILGKDRDPVHRLLRQIPPGQAIWDEDADIGEGSPAWRLWELIDACPGTGPTITSKLLASKRPALLPIYDSVVPSALFSGSKVIREYWELWRSRLRGPEGEHLRTTVTDAQREAARDIEVSVLRMIDIVVWMIERRSP